MCRLWCCIGSTHYLRLTAWNSCISASGVILGVTAGRWQQAGYSRPVTASICSRCCDCGQWVKTRDSCLVCWFLTSEIRPSNLTSLPETIFTRLPFSSDATLRVGSPNAWITLSRCVPGCTLLEYDKSLAFHSFPSDQRLKRWLIVKIWSDMKYSQMSFQIFTASFLLGCWPIRSRQMTTTMSS